ncbi:hypothetical protein LEP1GSC043_4562 [Leptospira weilii str. Ecochallenge]|uniref:Uncharacterized protein n=1 Tax=Leptospira weilii str. Ecochallenge TaxID=1049986 RepID=N1TUS1_9LEPT|nr:hypothetical protein LEP1GSC043_4562 [Leptospira weilii str. Ecochallenge]
MPCFYLLLLQDLSTHSGKVQKQCILLYAQPSFLLNESDLEIAIALTSLKFMDRRINLF